jgi:predicted O-methyltransferase YrrM
MYLNRFSHFPRLINMAGLHPSFTILEVGSYIGSSLIAWNEASGKIARLIVVDSWFQDDIDISNPTAAAYDASLNSGKAEKIFWKNVDAAGLQSRLTVHKGDSRILLPWLRNVLAGIDLIFIDGNHQYEYAKADIINSKSLVRDGGILCGDDLNCSHYPGVTKAVQEVFGNVADTDGIWAIRKVGSDWKPV